jgi:hypothetical protein
MASWPGAFKSDGLMKVERVDPNALGMSDRI